MTKNTASTHTDEVHKGTAHKSAAHKGTRHFKFLELSGLVMIASFPFMLIGLLPALAGRAGGITQWLGGAYGAMTLFVFFTAAIIFCKQALDDVFMDYLGEGTLNIGLLLNKIAALLMWVIVIFCIYKLWLGA